MRIGFSSFGRPDERTSAIAFAMERLRKEPGTWGHWGGRRARADADYFRAHLWKRHGATGPSVWACGSVARVQQLPEPAWQPHRAVRRSRSRQCQSGNPEQEKATLIVSGHSFDSA